MRNTKAKPKSIQYTPPPKPGQSGTFGSFEQFSDWLNYYDMEITGFRGSLILVSKRKRQETEQEKNNEMG